MNIEHMECSSWDYDCKACEEFVLSFITEQFDITAASLNYSHPPYVLYEGPVDYIEYEYK